MSIRIPLFALIVSLFFGAAAVAQEVDIPLTISNDIGDERVLQFGLDPTATNGIDDHLGEAELPPFPPSSVFEARFVGDHADVPAEIGLGSYSDYREGSDSFEGQVVHQLSYQVGDGNNVTVAWDFPAGVSGHLEDLITGGIVDETMEGTGSFTVPSGINELKFTVNYSLDDGGDQTAEVDIPIFVSNNIGDERELRFGLDPTATNGIDDHLGEAELPPFPPSSVFEARFIGDHASVPAEIGLGSYRDYREGDAAFTGDVVHQLSYQVGDGDHAIVTWNMPAGVTGQLNDAITGTIVDETMEGSGSFNVPGGINELLMTITYAGVNQPPEFTSTPVTEVDAFEDYVYNVTATDPDGDAITLTTGPLPGWLSFTDNGDGTGNLSGTPTNDDAGDHEITITASDGDLSVDQEFTITVNFVNQPPEFTSTPVTEVDAFEQYVYNVTATDPDGDALTLTTGTLPGWLSFTDNGDGTGVLSGTPNNDDAGDYPITITASDGDLSVDQDFTITVHFVNQPPEFTSTPVTEVDAFEQYVYNVTATDPDGDALTLTTGTLPGWLSFTDNGDGTGVLSGTPTNDDAGDHPITITASDGDLSVDQTFTITVHFVNQPPEFTSTPVTEVDAFEEYVYNVTATDPDGQALTLTTGALPDWLSFVDNGDGTGVLSGTPTNDDVGDHAITITASDGDLSVDQAFTITVNFVNQPPEITSTPVTNATVDVAYEYNVTATDPDGQAITLTTGTLPGWLGFVDNNDGTGVLSGTPGEGDVGDHDITITASDGDLSVNQEFTITVHAANQPPVFTSEPVTDGFIAVEYAYSVEATDPDGDSISFATSALPAWLTFVDNQDGTGLLSGTPGVDDAGDHAITITASDGEISTDQAFTITVQDVMTMAEARTAGVGATVTVQGTVSRALGAFTYFQDDTAALTIRQTSGDFFDDVAAGTIDTGTDLVVTGELSAFGDLMQINDGDMAGWEILGQGPGPDPAVITLDDIDGDSHQAQLVHVVDLWFPTASGDFSAATTYQVADASIDPATFDFRIPNATDTEVDGTPIPLDLFSFTGVVGHFFDGPQLLAILESDIDAVDVPMCEIDPNPIAFGDVMVGDDATTEATVSNTGTAACVLLSAQIDEDDFSTDFEGTVTVEPGGSASFNVTFAPSAAGSIEGTLTLVGENDVEVSAQLTGTGIAPPEAAVDPAALFFVMEPDATASATLTLSNEAASGAADLEFSITIDGQRPDSQTNTFTVADRRGDQGAAGRAGAADHDLGRDQQAGPGEAAMQAGGGMVSVSPLSGTIVPGGDQDLTVTVDTEGLDPGTFEVEIMIATNDPANEVIVVPVEVTVETDNVGDGSEVFEFAIEQNYPNPFAAQTTIDFSLAEAGPVRIEVYDAAGRQVATIVDADMEAGNHTATWDANGVASGVYFYRIQAGTFTETMRALIVR